MTIDRMTAGASDPSSAVAAVPDDARLALSELRRLVTITLVDEEGEASTLERHAVTLATTVNELSWFIVAVSLGAMVFVLARLVAPLVRRIVALNRVTRGIAGGDYDVRLDDGGTDELAELGRTFSQMARELQASRQAMSRASEDMRLVLDTVEQGLVAVDADGRMSSQCSRQLSGWLGD
jgi:two-component system phosphate regulon sensor histidine kinase PhoR